MSIYVSFLEVMSSCFLSLVPCAYRRRKKQVTDVSIVLKNSFTESENLSLLVRLSVSDGQKTNSSKVVSFIGIK